MSLFEDNSRDALISIANHSLIKDIKNRAMPFSKEMI